MSTPLRAIQKDETGVAPKSNFIHADMSKDHWIVCLLNSGTGFEPRGKEERGRKSVMEEKWFEGVSTGTEARLTFLDLFVPLQSYG